MCWAPEEAWGYCQSAAGQRAQLVWLVQLLMHVPAGQAWSWAQPLQLLCGSAAEET